MDIALNPPSVRKHNDPARHTIEFSLLWLVESRTSIAEEVVASAHDGNDVVKWEIEAQATKMWIEMGPLEVLKDLLVKLDNLSACLGKEYREEYAAYVELQTALSAAYRNATHLPPAWRAAVEEATNG
jgi:hypothetical protein